MPNHYLEIAKKSEEIAKNLKETRKKSFENKKIISGAYEETGNAFINAGYPEKAKENYLIALEFATTKKDKERLEGKIKKLHSSFVEKQEILELLKSGLEKRVAGFIAFSTLLISIFFIYSNLTGFAIANSFSNYFRWIGFCFFVCGLIFTFIFLRIKNRQFSKDL